MADEDNKEIIDYNSKEDCEENQRKPWIYWIIVLIVLGLLLLSEFK